MIDKPARLDARSLRDLVLDPGSWTSWDSPVIRPEVSTDYARELAQATEKTRQDESIITGEGRLRGRRVAVVAGEFGFLAGSIGSIAASTLALIFCAFSWNSASRLSTVSSAPATSPARTMLT